MEFVPVEDTRLVVAYLRDKLGDEVMRLLESSYLDLRPKDLSLLADKLRGILYDFYMTKAISKFPSYESKILRNIVSNETMKLAELISALGLIRSFIRESSITDLVRLRGMLMGIRNKAIAFSRGFLGITVKWGSYTRDYTTYRSVIEKLLCHELRGEELEVIFVKDRLAQYLIRRVVEWCNDGIRFLNYNIKSGT